MSKDNRGFYDITFTFDGKRYRVRATTRKELAEKVEKKKQELKEGRNAIYSPTLSQYYEHFTKLRSKQIKESTVRSQASQIKSVLNHIQEDNKTFGEMKIKDITRRDIERVREELQNEGNPRDCKKFCVN